MGQIVSDTGPIIGLAKIEKLDLLIDDYAGRKAARDLKIGVTGLVGLLLLAKERGLVEKVTPLIERIRGTGYWLSDEVVEIARRLAGE